MNALDFCDKEEIILFRQSDMSAEIFADAWLFITALTPICFNVEPASQMLSQH